MRTTRITNSISGLLFVLIVLLFWTCASNKFARELSENPATIVDTLQDESSGLKEKTIYNRDIITTVYEKGKSFLSAKWNNRDKITQMISAIRNISEDGLNPDDYHLQEIERLTEKIAYSENIEVDDIGRLELLLTDSFKLLTSHLSTGKTDPETIDPQWKASRRIARKDWGNFIDSTLNSNDIIETLQNLTPGHPDYYNLKKALVKYRKLEEKGGWPNFSTSLPKLEKGMSHPDVSLLRKRLAVTQGDIKCNPEDTNLFDQNLYDQVVLFQQRNGLDADGVVGKATIAAINIPVHQRIEAIEANLERWRWISDNLGERYIRVNIANFELQVIENGEAVFHSPAIVGRLYKETPVFSSAMKYLVINPDWAIPPEILKSEIIPDIIKNPNYLTEKNMKVLRMDGSEIDPSTIVWDSTLLKSFPYMIRQESGRNNPLGHIKFIFPNEYSVYIHDTPSRSLFLRSTRTFSHGCIRINKAHELAEYLLKDDPEWNPSQLQKAIDQGQERTIILPNPVPVHILYLTAWADDDGTPCFCKDIYNRDQSLIKAIKKTSPERGSLVIKN
jgi:murein L,D-transpeptidase YcbB/YkuD